jgi:hypothetical protein
LDLSSRSLELVLTSSTALSPELPKTGLDISVVVAGRTLTQPFGSTLILRNNGAKPILPGEVEGPIEVEVTGNGRLVQAQIVDRHPLSLSPVLSISGAKMSIQPLLLNPGDGITIAVLTENGVPIFSARARIAGISDVILREAANSPRASRAVWIAALCAPFAVSTVFMFLATTFIPGSRFHPVIICVTSVGALGVATISAGTIWNQYFEISVLSTVAFSVGFGLICTLPMLLFLRHNKPKEYEP